MQRSSRSAIISAIYHEEESRVDGDKNNPFKAYENLPPDPVPMSDEEHEQWEKRNEGEWTSLEELRNELGL
jgi:hypothetical protein